MNDWPNDLFTESHDTTRDRAGELNALSDEHWNHWHDTQANLSALLDSYMEAGMGVESANDAAIADHRAGIRQADRFGPIKNRSSTAPDVLSAGDGLDGEREF